MRTTLAVVWMLSIEYERIKKLWRGTDGEGRKDLCVDDIAGGIWEAVDNRIDKEAEVRRITTARGGNESWPCAKQGDCSQTATSRRDWP